MQTLSTMAREHAGGIKVVLCDIDDTLTDHGRLPATAYSALERLRSCGLIVAPVTGRPAGWCDMIARQWPVDGVVGENGAFYFRYDDVARRMTRAYAREKGQRAADAQRLEGVRRQVLGAVPAAAVAADQSFREADLAIDFCEDVAPLPACDVARIVEIFHDAGATAKISSIHVNGWFGAYDKLSTTRRFLHECFGLDIDKDNRLMTFIGDSPNDSPMFAFFSNSVGVANVRDFGAALPAQPAYVTEKRGARGFVEFAEWLIEAKGVVDGTRAAEQERTA